MTDQSTHEVGHKSTLPVGKILASARTEQGMTTDMVAARLCLTENYIKALEAGNFEVLPGDTFIRGYLRNYADIVGLNGEELVRLYIDQQDIARQHAEAQNSEKNTSHGNSKLVLIAIVIIALVAVVVVNLEDGEEPAPQVPSSIESSDEALSESGVESTATADEIVAEESSATEQDLEVNEAVEETSQETEAIESVNDEPATETEVSVSAADDEVSVESESLPALATEALSFTFNGDCWYQVVDATGAKLAERSKSAGETSVVEGVPPFTVTLGDTTVVDVMYEGEKVDLTAYYARKSARFQVGE